MPVTGVHMLASVTAKKACVHKKLRRVMFRRFWKSILLAGVLITPFFFLLLTVLGALWPGYNAVRQHMSEVGAVNSPYKEIMNLFGFILVGALVTLVGVIALQQTSTRLKTGLIVAWLTIISGVAFILVGIFPCDPKCIDVTLSGRLHTIFSMVPAMLLPTAAILSYWLLDNKRIALLAVAFGVLSFLGGTLMSLPAIETLLGLFQRLGMFFAMAWVSLFAYWLRTRLVTNRPDTC